MADLDQHLMAREQVVFRTSLHPIVLAPGVVTLVIGCFLIGNEGLRPIGIGLVLVSLTMLLNRGLPLATNEYGVTTSRVIIKTGWGSRKSLELQLQKVEGLAIQQSLIGRIFDYGTLRVGGTGGTKEFFKFVKAPITFQRHLQEAIARGGVAAPATSIDSNRVPRVERKCPWCAESILAEARVCKHCGREVVPAPV